MRAVLCVCLWVNLALSTGAFESMRAYFWYKNGHYERALGDYERIYATQRHCENAYNLANVYYKMGVYASAVRLYQEGLELPCAHAYYALLWHNLGNALFMLHRYVEAHHAFENAQNLAPSAATQTNLAITRELLEQRRAVAAIITKPKARDSREIESTTPLLALQIAKSEEMSTKDVGLDSVDSIESISPEADSTPSQKSGLERKLKPTLKPW